MEKEWSLINSAGTTGNLFGKISKVGLLFTI